MPITPITVLCEHRGTCSARNAYGNDARFPRDDMDFCGSCGGWFHPVHSHGNPSARPAQYCADHELYHPACWSLMRCEECGERSCFIAHGCQDGSGSGYIGSWRNPVLNFEGDPGTHRLAMGKRFVGMEIEVENGSNFELPDDFGIVEDGSLSNGVEVLSPPARGSALVEKITSIMATLKGAGWEATSSCGLHVHLDARDKRRDKRYLSRLFALGFAIEDVLFSLQESERHENSYSIPLRKHYSLLEVRGPKSADFEYIYEKTNKSDRRHLNADRLSKYGGQRYHGFNFHSVFHRGTLECRIHEGTTDAVRILHWAEILQAVLDKAEKRISYNELIKVMKIEDRPKKIDAVGRLLRLNDESMDYLHNQARPRLVQIPWYLTKEERYKAYCELDPWYARMYPVVQDFVNNYEF